MSYQPSPSEAHRFDRALHPSTPEGEPSREDIEADWSSNAPAGLVTTTIAELREQRVFLLLGELGVGKTWLFEHECLRLRAAGEKYVHFVRLGEFSDLADLDAETFAHPDLAAARRSGDPVHLFLDSLDQGVTLIPQLHQWLYRRIRDDRAHRNVRIRVSSRVVPHARTLAANLADLFGTSQSDILVYVGMLTKREILDEARAAGVDAKRFVDAVAARNAETLAVHPLTLALLLREYTRTHKLAAQLVDLYRDACGVLTQEHEGGQTVDPPAAGTVAYTLTGRIAALMALTGKPLLSVAPPTAMPESSIGPEVVTSVPETISGRTVSFSYGQVRYVLTNAHFQAGSPDAYRWIHVSLQSFMAAEWLADRLDASQIVGLLVHPLDRRGQVRVDLEEIAAWLAGMVPAIRDYLLRVQPLVLLTSQSQAGALGNPVTLLRTLLTPDNAMLIRWRNVRDVRLRRLRSAQLSAILRPALTPTADRDSQWLALAIVRQTRTRGLDQQLLQLLEDPNVAEFVAVSAGLALEVTGSVSARRKIGAMLRTPGANTLPDEIKAVLLRASWPGFISAETLFSVLTPSTDEVLGLYDTLPAKWILDNLQPSDLVPAIEWVSAQQLSGYIPTTRSALIAGILDSGLRHVERSDVRGSLVRWMHGLAKSDLPYQEIDALSPLREMTHITRDLVVAAVDSSDEPLEFITNIVWQLRSIVFSLDWLLAVREEAVTLDRREAWLWLIERTPPTTKSEFQHLQRLARRDRDLAVVAERAVVVPRRPTRSNQKREAPMTRVGPTVSPFESEQERLLANLDRAATDRQAALDIAELVWKSADGNGLLRSMWSKLAPDVRRRLNRFFAQQLVTK